jgi:hypothetical protein
LTTFLNQPNVSSVASFVAECLALGFFLAPFLVWLQAFHELLRRCPL